MSVINTFDEWYAKLSSDDKQKLLGHILNTKCNVACEGFHSGPHGVLQKGLFVAPAASASQNKCALCGR